MAQYSHHATTNWQPFCGQKKNEINRVTLISQHSNEVSENEKQLVNIDLKHIFGFIP